MDPFDFEAVAIRFKWLYALFLQKHHSAQVVYNALKDVEAQVVDAGGRAHARATASNTPEQWIIFGKNGIDQISVGGLFWEPCDPPAEPIHPELGQLLYDAYQAHRKAAGEISETSAMLRGFWKELPL